MYKQMNFPIIKNGYIVYHHYSSYEALDSKLYIFNFKTQQKICISDYLDEGVIHAMNGHLNGTLDKIVFMAIKQNEWRLFTFDLVTNYIIQLHTNGRTEDPKFSKIKNKIVYKKGLWSNEQDSMVYSIVELNIDSNEEITLVPMTSTEVSMPYYDDKEENVYYVTHSTQETICKVNISNLKTFIIEDSVSKPYYPIVFGKYLTYAYNYSHDNNYNNIVKINTETGEKFVSSFNSDYFDTSDAYMVSQNFCIMSSTRDHNTYDLFLANFKTGETYSLDYYGLNQKGKQNLGASCAIDIIQEMSNEVVVINVKG